MDDILNTDNGKWHSGTSLSAVCFIGLIFIFGITAYITMSITEGSAFLNDIRFYDRYDSVQEGVDLAYALRHLTEAVRNALPGILQILVLFLLSFSPLLIPAGITVTVFRGIVSGVALSRAGSFPENLQAYAYTAISVIICFMCSSFLQYRHSSDLKGSRSVLKKTVLFLISSGACTAVELTLSFIM